MMQSSRTVGRMAWVLAIVGAGTACSGAGEGDNASDEATPGLATGDAGTPNPPGDETQRLAEGETVATVEQSLVDNQFAVGVIPVGPGGSVEGGIYGTTCPADSQLVTIYMDDEDDQNRSGWGEWRLPQDPDTGGLYSFNGWNSPLRFCKVNGQDFHPRTTNINDKANFYAVLKLGISCPNGSTQFTRYFDNEDDSNANSRSGPIAPNVSNTNTTLVFCFFRSGSVTMSDFPFLGIPYAVYHDFEGAQPFPYNLETKSKHTSDDEDDGNQNSMSPTGTSAYFDFTAIISNGPNTWFDVGRVW